MTKHLHIPGVLSLHGKGDSVVVGCARCDHDEVVAFWSVTPLKGWRKTGWATLLRSIELLLLAHNPPKFMVSWTEDMSVRTQFLQAQTLKAAKVEARSYRKVYGKKADVRLLTLHESALPNLINLGKSYTACKSVAF